MSAIAVDMRKAEQYLCNWCGTSSSSAESAEGRDGCRRKEDDCAVKQRIPNH